ncbi:hypothetical protein PG993_004240 [Apiospora rasikravindrae]|uniref:MYND-type domain-containing protein n=1 Tax=Apiospora rasikravindrae TaxID=990691 RepID=A0ABR1TC89_9PEZI
MDPKRERDRKIYDRKLFDGTFFPLPDAGRTMEQYDPSADKLCVMCEKTGMHRCGRCGTAYCSKKCQIEDWAIHKKICRDMAGAFAASQRPNEGSYRVLMFPDGDTFKLNWVFGHILMHREEHMAMIHEAELGVPPPSPTPTLDNLVINYSIPWRKCGHGLRIISRTRRDTTSTDGLSRSFMSLLPSTGHVMTWDSIFCITAEDTTDPSATKLLDFTPRDLRSVVDFFQSAKANPCIVNPSRFPVSLYNCEMWPAIKINCDGDIKRFKPFMPAGKKLPRYEPVTVSSVPLDSDRYDVFWANALDLPWVMSVPNTNGGLEELELLNITAMWFCTCMVKWDSEEDATKPLRLWNKIMGTVIVSHKRGAKLHPLHLRWLHTWKEDSDKVWESEDSAPNKDRHGMRDAMLGHKDRDARWVEAIDRAKQHWTLFLEKNKQDPDAATVVSPWDI